MHSSGCSTFASSPRPTRAAPPPTIASACSLRAGSAGSTAPSSISACPSTCGGRSSTSGPRRSLRRTPTPPRRRSSAVRSPAAASRRSCSRCTATGGLRRGCTALRRDGSSLRSPTSSGAPALRRADAVRALSGYTEGLVEEVRGAPATASFEAYMDLSTFTATPPVPLPERPTALFVGVLEAYKNIDGLAAAWRRVARDASRGSPRHRRRGQSPGRRRRPRG